MNQEAEKIIIIKSNQTSDLVPDLLPDIYARSNSPLSKNLKSQGTNPWNLEEKGESNMDTIHNIIKCSIWVGKKGFILYPI